MLRTRLYYAAKPYLPRRLRLALRRTLAQRQRRRAQAVWPIDPRSAIAPAGWAGWPDGHRFAFVITHDVESGKGLAQVRRLAELEMSLGFRSSFNFIPEGPYRVPDGLRSWLAVEGFEVGVHDLHHDGKLLSSKAEFARRAVRINQHLRAWGAVGFRAGFMLHNLEWFRDLDIQYDLSTFDTDPFEPQPDAAGTIFPFRVPPALPRAEAMNSQAGYIEMPYTLPQDSTLFLILRESGPALWRRKADWVAEHGGLLLVNVHPDYIQFAGDRPARTTYPVAHYVALLQHLRSVHGSDFWHGLPRDAAQWVAASPPARTAGA